MKNKRPTVSEVNALCETIAHLALAAKLYAQEGGESELRMLLCWIAKATEVAKEHRRGYGGIL